MTIRIVLTILFLASAIVGCKSTNGDGAAKAESPSAASEETGEPQEAPESAASVDDSASADGTVKLPEDPPEGLAQATFAGGCFWCMEPPFDKVEGVEATISGYAGGPEKHPSYREVARGKTGHAEVVRVYYDPAKVSYEKLLHIFWRNIDPTQEDGQFVDRGAQYRTAIYYHDEEQQRLARKTKGELEASGKFDEPIVTEIEPAGPFWKAEDYHQNFYEKSPMRYESYRTGSGRDQFIERVWGDQKWVEES